MSQNIDFDFDCADCDKDHYCYQGIDCTGMAEELKKLYNDPEIQKIQRVSTAIEAEFYSRINRLMEIIIFCKRMGYQKIGVAFCIGLAEEAEILCRLLGKHFEVCSVICKAGGLDKADFNLPQIHDDRYEAICNPAGQAELLNRAETDLNIICGLCVGHDIIFTKFSKAPVTTFIVKDRMLAHNTVGALTCRYQRRRVEEMGEF